jgi:hypothetical protein
MVVKLQHNQSDYKNLVSANKSPMKVELQISTDIYIGGIRVPAEFVVIETLVHDIIIGNQLLKEMSALIDTRQNLLILFDGLTAVPMTRTGQINVIKTICSVNIAPFSEAIISVKSMYKPPLNISDYMIDSDVIRVPNKSLMIARVLVDVNKDSYPCKILNPTDKVIKLQARTPIGILAPVTIEKTLNRVGLRQMCVRRKSH